MNPILFLFIGFVVLLMSGLPLAFSLGGLSVVAILLFYGNVNVMFMLVSAVNTITQSPVYVAAPLFIFMGTLLEKSGVSDKLFDSMYIIMGRLKGGLAIATILICTLLAATTGVIAATIALMTMLALPAMLKYRYNRKLATGTIMAVGCLGQLLPPSVIMIVFAGQAQLSVGRMFAGGIGAGLMFSALFILYVVIRTIINPDVAPAASREESDNYSTGEKVAMLLKSVAPTLFLIVMVLGSIMFGFATPTEAAAVGCMGALLLVILNRRFSLKMIIQASFSTTLATAMIFFIITAASMFAHVFIGLRGGVIISEFLQGLPFGPWGILIVILLIVVIVGFFIDAYGLVMIGVPVFMPIIIGLGFDPLWFAVLFITMLVMSFMTPPFSYAAFYVKGSARMEINMGELYGASWQYVAIYVVGIALLCIFPQIITFLPSVLF